eukprot:jgi/Botrbrau1/9026/Bobra.0376s0004.2
MEFFSSNSGRIDPATQAQLEVVFQSWLAAKRVRWDLLIYMIEIGYAIAYSRTMCPQIFHKCGCSCLVAIILALTGLGLLPFNRLYCKMRQYIFAGLWFTSVAAGSSPHPILERAAKLSEKPGTAFAMILMLKVPPLVSLYGLLPVKVAWAPLVHILTTIVYHVSSVHAAGQYEADLRYNSWVQQVVNGVNCLIRQCLKGTFLLFGEPPPDILAELELPEAFLSTPQCLIGLWIVAQASVSWLCLLLTAREELNERRAFLAASRLPYVVHSDSFQQKACHLAAVHFLVCFYLISVGPLLFDASQLEGGRNAGILK